MAIDANSKKNPAAVALGRLGGLKGGPALAAKMTPAQRLTAFVGLWRMGLAAAVLRVNNLNFKRSSESKVLFQVLDRRCPGRVIM